MTNEMTAEEAIKWLKDIERSFPETYFGEWRKALKMAIQALQPKPMEKFDDVKTHIQRLAGDYKCWDNRLTWEEALELNRMLEAQHTCENINEDYAECDQFQCSECHIELQDWHRVERDDDDGEISYHEYTFRYCPNCGRRVKYAID